MAWNNPKQICGQFCCFPDTTIPGSANTTTNVDRKSSTLKISLKPDKPTLYYLPESIPCRTVIAVARILNMDIDLIVVDLLKGEHLKEEFKKINPLQQIPTFVDTDGYCLSESRAICMYLVQTRQPQSALYPSDNLKQRAQIDRWLFYDCGTLFKALQTPMYELYRYKNLNENSVQIANDTLKKLDEIFPTENKFLTGNEISIADLSMFFTLGLLLIFPKYNIEQYPNIKNWYNSINESLKHFDRFGFFEKALQSLKQMSNPALKNL